jgi:hypothetical protein
MDFMRLLQSLGELLYELVTWILFYPLTLWRVLRHPIGMMAYAEAELDKPADGQYSDTVNPPIFLLLTLLLAYLLGAALHTAADGAMPAIFADVRNLLLFRAIIFALVPLLLAVVHLRQRGAKLTRETLRPPFYSQCYTTAPFVLAIDCILPLWHVGNWGWFAGLLLFAAGLAWYLTVETIWLAGGGRIGRLHAFALATGTLVLGVFIIILLAVVVGLSLQDPTPP